MKFAAAVVALTLSACSIFGGGQPVTPAAQARISLVVLASAESAIIRTCATNIRNYAANGNTETAQKIVNVCNKYVVPVAYGIEAVAQDVDAATELSSGDTTYNKLTCVAYSAVQNFTATAKALNAMGVPVPQEVTDAVDFVGGFASNAEKACDPLNPNGSVPQKPASNSAPTPSPAAAPGESM